MQRVMLVLMGIVMIALGVGLIVLLPHVQALAWPAVLVVLACALASGHALVRMGVDFKARTGPERRKWYWTA